MIERRSVGKPIRVELEILNVTKYVASPDEWEEAKQVVYNNVEHWEIWDGDDAEAIEHDGDDSSIDPLHEYLVLCFTDGSTSTFRNSFVDMHRLW